MKLSMTVILITVTPIVLATGSTLAQGQVQRAGASAAHAATLTLTKQGRMQITAVDKKNLSTGGTRSALFAARADGIRIVSRDGHALQATSIRAGDLLKISANGLLQDLSQQRESLRGVVSAAPATSAEPLTLLIQHSTDIVVDTSKQTRYSDRSEETRLITGLEDADQVVVSGILDTRLGEMTQTDVVSRVGPLPQRAVVRGPTSG